MLRDFPMSLTGAASHWLRNEPSESDESLFQAWERFKELLMKYPQHYLTDMHEVILFYNGLDVPTRQILDSKGAIPTKIAADAKIAIHEMAEYLEHPINLEDSIEQQGQDSINATAEIYSYTDRRQTLEESLTKFIVESAKRHKENSNIIKDIRASTDAAIRNQGASIKTSEIQIGQMSKVLQERGIRGLPGSIEPNIRDHVKSISTVKADSSTIHRIGSGPYAVSDARYNSLTSETVSFPRRLHGYYCDDWKEALVVDPGASVSVMPLSTYSNLGLGNLAHTRLTIELANRTIKHPRGIAENVLVRIGKFIFPIDFIILDIPEDDDVPLILGRPSLSTPHAKIDVFKRKFTLRVGEEKLVFKSVKPATSIIRMVYMVKERTDIDSKTKFVGEAINESFDPLYGNYIELNDLDMPLEP
ncbi:hypothetical protein Tco_1402837 [Tanacetum coccineum]